MTAKRIVLIVLIYLLGVGGWIVLGAASSLRSASATAGLESAVWSLWGAPVVQPAPSFTVRLPGSRRTRQVVPSTNRIVVDLRLEQRRKGLVWYPTFVSDFDGTYELTNQTAVAQKLRVHFPFPSRTATYDRFNVWVDGSPEQVNVDTEAGVRKLLELEPSQTRSFRVAYRTRGLRVWRYSLAGGNGRVSGLDMVVTTDFQAVDFPEGSLSPMALEVTEQGARLAWTASDLITRQDVAVSMPEKLNPGPLAARMSFFAPVCLLFFFVLVTAIGVLRKLSVHPMHYLFVASGFFAFHLLFAYLVDHVNVHGAFIVASLVSMGLVVTYLRAALGKDFPWTYAALGQLFYLVLFSYSFFLEGMTGLTVTLGSVLTLAALMVLTARLDWNRVFARAP
jgi:hypothetical protein